jgi:LPXTG-motif cell wall-anchored protein
MKRRIATTLGVAALTGSILAASAATAAPPAGLATYGAGATGTALQVTLLGQDLAFARTGAVITDAPQAAADGAALLVAGTPVPSGAPSQQPGGEASNEVCPLAIDTGADLAPELELLNLALACVRTVATVEGGAPAAGSTGEVVSLSVSGAPLSPTGPLAPVTEPLLGGVRDLIGALAPIDEQLAENLGISLDALVNSLLDNLEDGRVLAVSAGATQSTAAASAEVGAAGRATADAARVELFPDLPGGALLTITSGASSAQVVRDPASAVATTEVVPAVLSVQANEQLLGILTQLTDALNTGVAQLSAASLPCDESNPLVDLVCIEVAGDRVLSADELAALGLDFGEGTVGVASNAVRIQALRVLAEQLGGPGVGISLAETAAAANATVELPAGPDVPRGPGPVAAPPELPRTGTDPLPVALLLGLVGAAGLALVLLRRSSVVT